MPPAVASAAANSSWKAAALPSSAWYCWPYPPNSLAMASDTSSLAAATNAVVGPVVFALESVSADRILSRSAAVAANSSGAVTRYAISPSLPTDP
ncbi:transcriptional regulator [Mycobacterium tuberculosis]|nr:transcriptional regulator [Mycobacterium tuberculosis]